MKKYKFMLCRILILILLCTTSKVYVKASVPYSNYNYTAWDVKKAPQAYLPSRLIRGEDLGIGELKDPSGIFVQNEKIYIVDTGNHRIIICDQEWKVINIIEGFKEPHDIFVTEDNTLYVADTKNNRIVKLNEDGEVLAEFGKPDTNLFSKEFVYEPMKVVVDSGQRIYAVTKNVNSGIVELNSDGEFQGYYGANKVVPNPAELVWRAIATKEQREGMATFAPIEYNNIYIDHKGFIYATSITDIENFDPKKSFPVKKLNSKGDNLFVGKEKLIVGDLDFNMEGNIKGPSIFTDVVVDENDIFSVLDSKRGRVFTYDYDGNLLFVFGGPSNQLGGFKYAEAIEQIGHRILVLDSFNGQITEFVPTIYGKNLRKAIISYRVGRYEESSEYWDKTLQLNSNLEMAYVGKARTYYREGNYKEALKNYKLGQDRLNYSKVLKIYRKEWLEENFSLIIYTILALILLPKVRRLIKKRKKRGMKYGVN